MKLTPGRRKFLKFMASTPGRATRFGAGVVCAILAFTLGGQALWLLLLTALFFTTTIMNYCPMGPLFGQSANSGELLKKLQTYELK